MSKNTHDFQSLLLIVLIVGVIAGGAAGYLGSTSLRAVFPPSEEELIREFYLVENAVHVSPHSLRKDMAKGESKYIVVDLRSEEEYLISHVRGAINIPAYKDKDTSDYGAVERIVASFAALPEDKDVVVYCYSTPCMTGRKVGKILAEKGIFVKHLGIGWNEWKHFWTLWNHEHEWDITNPDDYTWSGPEPGPPLETPIGTGCPIEGDLGC